VVAGFHTGDKRAGSARAAPMATDSTRRLHHQTPSWVNGDAVFHIRIRLERGSAVPLTAPPLARALLDSAVFYHRQATWRCHLFLLMPDHLHALLTFPFDRDMRLVVGRWKAWHVRTTHLRWQDNFFDHRIRNPRELQLKAHYIRQNPVVKSLCAKADDWPWAVGSLD
jgi:REP element-mobilizing transposase RayT